MYFLLFSSIHQVSPTSVVNPPKEKGIQQLRSIEHYASCTMEVVRGIWKGVVVPGLSFISVVLCIKSKVQLYLEMRQVEI